MKRLHDSEYGRYLVNLQDLPAYKAIQEALILFIQDLTDDLVNMSVKEPDYAQKIAFTQGRIAGIRQWLSVQEAYIKSYERALKKEY